MINFNEEEKKIYEVLKPNDKSLLINRGLSKLLAWSVIFLTVFISFLQLLTNLKALPHGEVTILVIACHVFKYPLWIFEEFLLIGIVLVVRNFFITYENQLIFETNLPGDINQLLWRKRKRFIADRFFYHDYCKEKKDFIKKGRVILFLIILTIVLNWILFFKLFENNI